VALCGIVPSTRQDIVIKNGKLMTVLLLSKSY